MERYDNRMKMRQCMEQVIENGRNTAFHTEGDGKCGKCGSRRRGGDESSGRV
ncbi:MAG: hypothetical protein SOT60_04490 [Bilifractor sp.]|nr:hypothetical protein [Lachnospiraceae bacterium]MDY2837180.1 hypothetical protein [Bilifractor sp.]